MYIYIYTYTYTYIYIYIYIYISQEKRHVNTDPFCTVFIPYRVQSCNYGAKTGPYSHSVFPVYIYIYIYIYIYKCDSKPEKFILKIKVA